MGAVWMRRTTRASWCSALTLVTALGALTSRDAHAQRRLDDTMATPRMMALGGRAEALGTSTSAMFANPAAIVGSRSFHTDGYFLWDPTVNRFMGGSSVIDSTRSLFAAGFAYLYDSTATSNSSGVATDTRSVHDGRVNVSLGFANHAIGIGGSVRYLNVSGGPLAQTGSTLGTGPWGGFTFAAGLYFKPVQALQISVMGNNLNNPETTAAPLSVSGGLAFTPVPVFSAVADVLFDFRSAATPRGLYSGGLELFLANHYAIRAGYQYDDIRGGNHTVTGGLGYLHRDFGVEFGMRQMVHPEMQTTLMLSIRYFYRPQDSQAQTGSTQTSDGAAQTAQQPQPQQSN